MELKDFMNSINFDKKNVIRDGLSPEAAEKLYPSFIVNRGLSYFPECIFYVNEINLLNIVDRLQHYEYLLYAIPKGKRFSKWGKAEKDDEIIGCIMKKYNYSRIRAKEVLPIMSDNDVEILINSYKISN